MECLGITTNKADFSRRDFLKIVAAVGGAGTLLKFAGSSFGTPAVVTDSRLLMGTVVNLTLIGRSRTDALATITAAIETMQGLERVLSRFIQGCGPWQSYFGDHLA